MPVTQFYSIHYPFTSESIYKTFLDLDSDRQKAIQSDIMHLIFTPKGQRIRNPEFGTNLIKYLFNPNDEDSWSEIKEDIKTAVSKFVPSVTFKNIDVYKEPGNGHGVIIELSYDVDENGMTYNYNVKTSL